MKDIHNEMAGLREAGRTFVLATIIKTAGSSPREAGAKMLVFADGSISGTIGGGKFEKLVIDDCLRLFKSDDRTLLKKYRFASEGPDSTGMTCGGEAQVFMELMGVSDKLVIFGGGHIGLALAGIAEDLGFRIAVIDDRQDFLDRFPSTIETTKTDAEYKENFPKLDRLSYVVAVTRGHESDKSVVKQALSFDCAYIGMIGSKNKVANVKADLKEQGFDEEKLNSIHAPIGLDIGAEGPHEIAVAIAAELIAVRRKKGESKSR